jgi:hypothetical protein
MLCTLQKRVFAARQAGMVPLIAPCPGQMPYVSALVVSLRGCVNGWLRVRARAV